MTTEQHSNNAGNHEQRWAQTTLEKIALAGLAEQKLRSPLGLYFLNH